MHALLDRERKAKGQRAPAKFPSLACKTKFLEAEERLGPDDLKSGMMRALEKSITSIPGIADFVAKWELNPKYGRTTEARERREEADRKKYITGQFADYIED